MGRKNHRASVARRLHRSLGVSTAAFILFMVLSGLAINHSQALGLDQRHLTQPPLLDWYGLGEPATTRSFEAGGRWISFAGSQLFLDGLLISTLADGVGAVSSGEWLIAASGKELLLLDAEGHVVERIPWEVAERGLIDSVGMLEGGIVSARSAGTVWLADSELMSWERAADITGTVQWSEPSEPPDNLREAILRQYRGAGVNLERVLLDLHSGRFFGPAGVLLYDLMALTTGFLAISGLVFWARGRRSGKKKSKRNV